VKICVLGLWHLGCVTAASMASLGHDVLGIDPDNKIIKELQDGVPPLFEPDLEELIANGLANGKLKFQSDLSVAGSYGDVLWVTFDTPVDEDDVADTPWVLSQVKKCLPFLKENTLVLISSQLPVGSTADLERYAKKNYSNLNLSFAVTPENLRLGKAINIFLHPDRIVIGYRTMEVKNKILKLFSAISAPIEWMSIESAEMTKHAINSFLAISVTFANEIAALCEIVGADAKEVERGLKTKVRIGPGAYLGPGGAFAGGTLVRDIEFLNQIAKDNTLLTPVISNVKVSNDEHKSWAKKKLLNYFNSLDGHTIAIWGITYKPGTNTLRRSLAVELIDWMLIQGAKIIIYDPVVYKLPPQWANKKVVLEQDPLNSLKNIDALVIGTEWPELLNPAAKITDLIAQKLLILDPNRHLLKVTSFADSEQICYLAVGSGDKFQGGNEHATG